MKKAKNSSFSKSFFTSLFVHAIFFLSIFFTPKNYFDPPKPQIVEIQYTEATPPPVPESVPTPKVAPPPPLEKQQVVDQDERAINDEKPENERFLSARNQVVKKQTLAKDRGEFRNAKAASKKSGNGGNPQFKPMTVEDFKPKFDIAKAVADHLEIEKEREKKSEEDALKSLEEKTAKKQESKKSVPVGGDTPGETGQQSSQSIDYIKDLDPGLETLLSTKEFVYYTYYARIRRQLNQHWGTKVREKIAKLYKSGRSIASSEDKVTKLLITLDRKGILMRAQVIGDSGVRDLDEAAVESFRAAAPFPNPPEGMVDPDGQIKIRWDFILEA